MKQILLSFAAFFCFCFSNAQSYKVDEKRIYSWDDVSSMWQHDLTEQYTYGNGGNKETYLLGIAMPSMENVYQNNKTYNGNNDIILDIRQFYNSTTMSWFNSSRTSFVYDGSNKLTSETIENYDLAFMSWENESRELYTYDGSDVSSFTTQNWNGGTMAWDNDEKADITYVSVGNPLQVIYSNWNSGTNMWDPFERDTATYSMGMISEVLLETFNGSTWDTDSRALFTFTGGLETEHIEQIWTGTTWQNEDRYSSTYDANGNRTVYIAESWDMATMSWKPYYKEEKDFSLASLSTAEFTSSSFKIYPNPAREFINISSKISIEKLEIFDALGKRVLESRSIEQINTEALDSGVYLLKAWKNDKSIVKRLVIH